MNNKEIIKKVMKEEVKGLNMKFKKSRFQLIFSYYDVVQILNQALKLKHEKEKYKKR